MSDYCLTLITTQLGERVALLKTPNPALRALDRLLEHSRYEVETLETDLARELARLESATAEARADLEHGRDPRSFPIHSDTGDVIRLQERLWSARRGFQFALRTAITVLDALAPREVDPG